MEAKADGRLEKVKANETVYKEAMELSKKWTKVMLRVKALREVLKSCSFANAQEADEFAGKLSEAERMDHMYAKQAAKLLRISKKKHLDEIVSLKALYYPPWLEARIKLTRSDNGSGDPEKAKKMDEGFGVVTKRKVKVKSKSADDDEMMEGF